MGESLEDHLRRATRNSTTRLPEDQLFALGRALAAELARAQAETPPRYPDIDPARIEMGDDAKPRLGPGGAVKGREADGLLALGALLHQLATGSSPDVSWRLDGPPPAEASTLRRRAALAALASPGGSGFATAAEAESALAGATAGSKFILPRTFCRTRSSALNCCILTRDARAVSNGLAMVPPSR